MFRDNSSELAKILRTTGPFGDCDPGYLLAQESFMDLKSEWGSKKDRAVWEDFATEFLRKPDKARRTIGLMTIMRFQHSCINQPGTEDIHEMRIKDALYFVSIQ
jgi:hypothetical protein